MNDCRKEIFCMVGLFCKFCREFYKYSIVSCYVCWGGVFGEVIIVNLFIDISS